MAKTVVGLFDNLSDAEAVVRELINEGAQREHISLLRTGSDMEGQSFGTALRGTTASGAAVGGTTTELGSLVTNLKTATVPGIGNVHVAGPLSQTLSRTSTGTQHALIDELTDRGVPAEDSRFYAEGVRRGSTLVLLRVHDDDADDVAAIMERHGALDIHERSTSWRTRGWSGFDVNARPFTSDEFVKEREACRIPAAGRTAMTDRTAATERAVPTGQTGDVTLPVVEEELQVGKRQVSRGAVRIVQEVRERPVEEIIRLREERVRVERRPVDRAVSPGRIDELKDRTIELTETAEEAVVNKTARVKEEVVIHKDTQVREEKVRDTVRSTDVRVEKSDKTIPPKR